MAVADGRPQAADETAAPGSWPLLLAPCDRAQAFECMVCHCQITQFERRMLAEALQAEVDAYIAAHAAERHENGRRLVVRNGCHQSREVLTSAGAVEVSAPRVSDKRTDPENR
jgi:hypothetical protein